MKFIAPRSVVVACGLASTTSFKDTAYAGSR